MKSPIASPPNFSRAARASSHATAASATTAAAGRTVTSERSTCASRGSCDAQLGRSQGAHQRRQGLPDRAHDDLGAVGHPALDASGAVRPAVPARSRPCGRSRRGRSIRAAAERRDRVADLDALGRLDREHRGGDPPVEARAGLDVGAEAGRHAERAHLGDAAERVAVALGRPRSRRSSPPRRRDRCSAPGERSARSRSAAREPRGRRGAHRADLEHVRAHLDPDGRDQRLRDGARRHPPGRLARARALEHVAHVVVAVLQHPGEVGVPGAGQRHRLAAPAVLLELLAPRPARRSSAPSSSCGRGSR